MSGAPLARRGAPEEQRGGGIGRDGGSRFEPQALLYGGDWSPEQWPRETWREDIELMRRAHVNTVTLGVFSWASLEPAEGVYETGWLDEVIGLLTDAGIGFLLATPTASPPPWFSLAHPDALPVRPDGVRLTHGSRDTYAISSPAYRAASRAIARMLAERYGAHPGLRGWHLHNEYGTLDHGPHAAAAFRRWLRERYGTLTALNEAWWTRFWSQGYSSFEQIEPPRATQYLPNPAQQIDFRRFSSDEMLAAMVEQREEIREAGSPAPVTTNFMLPTWNHLEQWSWAREQDVVSLDHYPDAIGDEAAIHIAYGADLSRSWSGGPWMLMEQNGRGARIGDRTYAKTPAQMIRHSLGYVARGAQSSLFFQWRASAGGSEQWHGALVPHAGADSRAFATTVRLGEILAAISPVAALPAQGRLVEAEVGIVWHADGWWALETPHLPSDALSYPEELRATHRALWRGGIPVDMVEPGADARAYRLLIIPTLYPLAPAQAAWLDEYVRAGGTLVVGPLTGMSDAHLRVITGGYPGMLRDLLGVRVEEIHPLAPGEPQELSDGSVVEEWTELLRTVDARALATYTHGELASLPAITSVARGAGRALYVSARLAQESRDALLQGLAAQLGIAPTLPGAAEAGLEAVRRRSAGADHLFLLHHGDAPVRVAAEGTDLITGASAASGLEIAAGGVAVLALASGADARLIPSQAG
ncbi:beta-galactosidase [Brachybacterium hainanense]|uniref:Beta-galactosidase n=1 Tax=Brachybacterium hainanense TaxID=1541174 RepID=A0ABV6R6K0_9MICO